MMTSGLERPDACNICRRICTPLRCRQCRLKWYCSVECQRRDWKMHRRACRAEKKKAVVQNAWKELQDLVGAATIQSLNKDYHLAADEVSRLEKEPGERDVDSTNADSTAAPHYRGLTQPDPSSCKKGQATSSPETNSETEENVLMWNFFLEHMPNLRCYQLRLQSTPNDSVIHTNSVRVSSRPTPDYCDRTILSIMYEGYKLALEFPGRVLTTPRAVPSSRRNEVAIRISYEAGSTLEGDLRNTMELVSPESCPTMACKNCNQLVLSSDGSKSSVSRVLELPSGRLSELGDYLSCYSGQATADFSHVSTMAQPMTLLEDANVLVAHTEDVGPALSLLATSGFGAGATERNEPFSTVDSSREDTGPNAATAMIRGSRCWSDAVGGDTLTCSLCASVLGFAPRDLPNTFRILKHQLKLQDGTRLQRMASFVANEMIRYAESKAIFTFAVNVESEGTGSSKCLMLRLLSWESSVATSDTSCFTAGHVCRPKFRKIVKILFEETSYVGTPSATSIWEWAQDFCCPPGSEAKSAGLMANSIVELCIPQSDWEDLKVDLREASNVYDDDVIRATIIARLGTPVEELGSVGLAGLLL